MPNNKYIVGSNKDDKLDATSSVDIINGLKGDDVFQFKYTDNKDATDDTLNNFDTIMDYQHGEVIKIEGLALHKGDVDYSIDHIAKQLKIQIDTDGDGKIDINLLLENIGKGDLVMSADKKSNSTEIIIYDDPAELGDGEEILLIEDTREESFNYIDKEDTVLKSDIVGGEELSYTDFDFV